MPLQKIVIVGGGTAGWMCAGALSKLTRHGLAKVTLIESEQIGTVGVGEATIPPIMDFNRLLEIDEATFLSKTQGTFKLGIQFENWGRKGDKYFHPFGNYGYAIDGISFHQIWEKYKRAGKSLSLDAYSPSCVAARHSKFAITGANHRPDLPPINYAYQFDATRYAKFLREYSEARGIVRREGIVTDVALAADSGNVESVKMQDGTLIEGDLFIDCSGFRGLLIEQTLKTGYDDWSHWLPCDRAVALPCEKADDATPYTRAIAHDAGWQWRIPLQHRTGNGHVYCSSFLTDDEALKTLQNNLDGTPSADPNFLRFTTGRRKKFWNKNVVALGLSAGFMEPLESTSLHLVQTAISKLVALLTQGGISPRQIDAFNRLTHKEYERIRDFLILHYKATSRDDTPFWNYCRTMDIPESLSEKIEIFKSNGQVFREEDELFTETSWVAVFQGQHIEPQSHNPMVDAFKEPDLFHEFSEVARSIEYMVQHMPTHEAFIDRYCRAERPQP
ncbi:tryptophan halogenase family protein [Hyphomonas sp.]|uniref:tryptophan halogenase family protein n=1 Tax=Hyphomonas sp. TaxID=87 RepID=UPI0039E2D8B5